MINSFNEYKKKNQRNNKGKKKKYGIDQRDQTVSGNFRKG